MKRNNLVLATNLGMCECGNIIATSKSPIDTFMHNPKQKCTYCEKELTLANFGYEAGNPHKVKWIGPDKKWTDTRPSKNFTLGRWQIIVGAIKTSRTN